VNITEVACTELRRHVEPATGVEPVSHPARRGVLYPKKSTSSHR
jgi:hypothetical protein